MKARRRNERGFTLLELLMVVVILAILAAIAVPQYMKVVEKSRMSEAVSLLAQVRGAESRYFAQFGTYVTTLAELDFNPESLDVVGTKFFNYSVVAGPGGIASGFQARAARDTALAYNAAASDCNPAGYTITLDETGVMTGTNCQ